MHCTGVRQSQGAIAKQLRGTAPAPPRQHAEGGPRAGQASMPMGVSGQTIALGVLMMIGTTMWALDYKRDAAFELMM